MREKVIYYSDELNDEFSKKKISPNKIDKNYKYIPKNIFWRIGHFILYRILATPFAFVYTKLKFKLKIKNKKAFKEAKRQGYFLYGNHTQEFADVFIPSVITFPKRAYIIAHANNVSMKGLKKITPMLGALPLPDDIGASKNFLYALEKRSVQGHVIVIYPEAHIWPYYTKIRPYKSSSFKYPIKFDTPTFCFTNTYQKRKFSKKPKIITYIDGPFYASSELSAKDKEKELRNKVYSTMLERSNLNNVEYIKYVKRKSISD